MSHKIEDLMRMSDEQLAYIAANSRWTSDRNNAARILRERRRKAGTFDARTKQLLDNLQTQVNTLTATNADLAGQIRASRDQISRMQRSHEQEISDLRTGFDNRLAEADRKHREDLLRLAREAQQGIEQAREELRNYFDNEIAYNMELVNEQITETRTSLEARIDATAAVLQDQITDIHTEISNIRSLMNNTRRTQEEMLQQARDYQSAAQAVLNAVDEFNIRRWRQEDRSALSRLNTRLTESLRYGAEGASTARDNGLELFEEALVYQQHVVADERQWQLRLAMADEAVAQAETLLDMSRTVPVKTSSGETQVDVDYWTCGDLRRIEEGLTEIRSRMEDPDITETQLQALQDLALTYRTQIGQSVNYALQAFQLSRGRKQLMDHAIATLTDPAKGGFFRHQWSEYFNGDPRLGYRAYLVDNDGTRVVITAELTNQSGDNPGNIFRSEILAYGTNIHNAQQAADYNDHLLDQLRRNTRAEFGPPQCSERANVVPDVGQGNQSRWTHPGESEVDHAVNQVGYRMPQNIQTQIRNQRATAGLRQ
jgi:hypothetical protein